MRESDAKMRKQLFKWVSKQDSVASNLDVGFCVAIVLVLEGECGSSPTPEPTSSHHWCSSDRDSEHYCTPTPGS